MCCISPVTPAACEALVVVHESHEASMRPSRGFVPSYPAATFGTVAFGQPIDTLIGGGQPLLVYSPPFVVPVGKGKDKDKDKDKDDIPKVPEPDLGLAAALTVAFLASWWMSK